MLENMSTRENKFLFWQLHFEIKFIIGYPMVRPLPSLIKILDSMAFSQELGAVNVAETDLPFLFYILYKLYIYLYIVYIVGGKIASC